MLNIWKSVRLLMRIGLSQPRLTLKLVCKELRRRMYANEISYGFEADLTREIKVSDPDIPVTVRELSDTDIPLLLNLRSKNLELDEFRHLVIRFILLEAGISTCYVAATKEGYPCCMCWLIQKKNHEWLFIALNKDFQTVAPDNVLCENMYTSPFFRGTHLRKHLTQRLFEKAKKMGAQRAVALIREDNKLSLVGTADIGWHPFFLKKTRWWLFHRMITYEPLPPSFAIPQFDRLEAYHF